MLLRVMIVYAILTCKHGIRLYCRTLVCGWHVLMGHDYVLPCALLPCWATFLCCCRGVPNAAVPLCCFTLVHGATFLFCLLSCCSVQLKQTLLLHFPRGSGGSSPPDSTGDTILDRHFLQDPNMSQFTSPWRSDFFTLGPWALGARSTV